MANVHPNSLDNIYCAFGERPSLDDIAEMKDGYVRWLRAIADTIMMFFLYIIFTVTGSFNRNGPLYVVRAG